MVRWISPKRNLCSSKVTVSKVNRKIQWDDIHNMVWTKNSWKWTQKKKTKNKKSQLNRLTLVIREIQINTTRRPGGAMECHPNVSTAPRTWLTTRDICCVIGPGLASVAGLTKMWHGLLNKFSWVTHIAVPQPSNLLQRGGRDIKMFVDMPFILNCTFKIYMFSWIFLNFYHFK